MNIMVINNGGVANMFTKYTAVTDENVEEVAKESVLMATNYGGIAVVVGIGRANSKLDVIWSRGCRT